LFHLLGGKEAGWYSRRMAWEGDMHWFLQHISGTIVDPTKSQFNDPPTVDDYFYHGIGCGFLTKKPSKRAKALMETMVWQ
jgi:hypothetical protein